MAQIQTRKDPFDIRPREYVSVIEELNTAEPPEIATYPSLVELLVAAVSRLQIKNRLPPHFGEISVYAARRDPARFINAVRSSASDDNCDPVRMTVYHPDHGVIHSDALLNLMNLEASTINQEMEISWMITLSAAHITDRDLYLLFKDVEAFESDIDRSKLGLVDTTVRVIVYRYPEGFIVNCDPEAIDDAGLLDRGYSRLFVELSHFAVKRGCQYLRLDGDGPVFPKLFPTYPDKGHG